MDAEESACRCTVASAAAQTADPAEKASAPYDAKASQQIRRCSTNSLWLGLHRVDSCGMVVKDNIESMGPNGGRIL